MQQIHRRKPCRSAISITRFRKNTSGWLLLHIEDHPYVITPNFPKNIINVLQSFRCACECLGFSIQMGDKKPIHNILVFPMELPLKLILIISGADSMLRE